MMAKIIALIALVIIFLIGLHFWSGGLALLNNKKWRIVKSMSPLEFEGGTNKIMGIFFLVIAVAFFVCTVPVVFYLMP